MGVNPTTADGTARALQSRTRTQKADMLRSEGLQGPKRADKPPAAAC
jgi:hypothetical protein